MGKFIISTTKRHEFVKSCGNQLSSLTINPGTSILNAPPGCSLNETDIRILNPKHNNKLTSQILDSPPISLFEIHKHLPLNKLLVDKPRDQDFNLRINNLEAEHVNDSNFNDHIETHSYIYIPLLLLSISLILTLSSVALLKLNLLTPIISSIQKIITVIRAQNLTITGQTANWLTNYITPNTSISLPP